MPISYDARIEDPPYLITYSLLMAYWSAYLFHIATTTPSVDLMFSNTYLYLASTICCCSLGWALAIRLPLARILNARHGVFTCLITLSILAGSPRTQAISPP